MRGKHRTAINFIPSIADLLFCSIFLTLFFSGAAKLLTDVDTGYHIRAGEYIARTLSIPRLDIFSFHTPRLPWTAHEWLSEVIMAAIHHLLGLTGVVAFFALLLAGTTAALFKILRSYGTDILLATVMTALVFLSSQIHWLARPHVFSFLLMVCWHHLLESWLRGGANRLYLLPALMLLWVNLHGGFLGGFILLGAYLAGALIALFQLPLPARGAQRKKAGQLCLIIAACLVASLANPYGYRILLFPFQLVSNSYLMDHVSEFLSPDFHDLMPFKYLLLLLIAVFALSGKTVRATELILILLFTNMALYSARYIPLFALIVAPILTRQSDQAGSPFGDRLRDLFEKRSQNIARMDARATGYLWPAAALLIVAVAAGSGKVEHSFDETTKPVAAVEFLMRERIAGNMFNNDEFGDYLIYRSYPLYPVFFDGRSDMYGVGKMKEYYNVINFQPGWELIFDKYRITWVFFDTDSNFSRYLLKDKNWVLIYADKVASIFVKKLPQHRDLIEKYRSAHPALSAIAAAQPG